MDKSKGELLGDQITCFVNAFGYEKDAKVAAEVIARSHKTLQQSTMKLILYICKAIAQNSTDDRNESAVAFAKRIVEISDDYPLPLI